MERQVAVSPSLRFHLERQAGVASGPASPALPRWRMASDVLGLAVFVLALGAYLVIRL